MLPKEIFRNIRRLQIKTSYLVNNFFAGAYRSAFKGAGLEFEDVREYHPGDDVESIDWHVTARMQRPFIKNFREERELTVMLLVDISASTQFGSSTRLKSQTLAEVAATLAFSAIKNHDKVGLLLFSSEIELYLRPQKNLRHVLRVIREILFFKPRHRGTDIQKVLAFLGRVQKRQTICFLLSDFLSPNFSHEAKLIDKRHDLILIDVYDGIEEEFPQLGLAHIRDLESDEMQLIDTSNPVVQQHCKDQAKDKRDYLKQLTQRLKADLITLRNDESYIDALHTFFRLRRQRR